MNHAVIDRDYAKKTEKALRQKKVWMIHREPSDLYCAERLNTISAKDGVIYQLQSFANGHHVIIWYRWED